MCELLGMECNVPTDIVFSFTALSMRGGQTGHHADGWGLALYHGRFARMFVEPTPAFNSQLARFVRDNPIRTLLAVAHVRKRTIGAASLENTHPFKRVLWGRDWVFAHNGTLPGVQQRALTDFAPVGETDSEHAFCWMLGQAARRLSRWLPGRPAAGAVAAGGRAGGPAGSGRDVQLPAGRRRTSVRPLRDQAVLRDPAIPVRAGHPARRRGAGRLQRPDHAAGPGGGDRHRTADPRRELDPGSAGYVVGVQAG